MLKKILRFVTHARRVVCSRSGVSGLAFTAALVIGVVGFRVLDVSNTSVLNFALCLVLAFTLIFIGISASDREQTGMEVGGYDDPIPDEGHLDDLEAELALPEPHLEMRVPRRMQASFRHN